MKCQGKISNLTANSLHCAHL